MFVDHSGYYEEPDQMFFGGSPQPPKRRGNAGAFVATAVIFTIVGALLATLFMQNIIGPGGTNNLLYPDATPSAAPTPEFTVAPGNNPQVTLTPNPTQRPMPDLDGVSPQIFDTTNPIPDIVEAVSKSVVGIINYGGSNAYGDIEQGSGTGFLISSQGYIVTNFHVIDNSTKITVVFLDDTEVEAQIIGWDKELDIAVLKVEAPNLVALALGDSDKLRVGEFTIAIGDPTGRELSGTTTFGIISALSRTVNVYGRKNDYIQTDAAINPGNSGGPLLNMKGEVIGITSLKTITASYDESGNPITAEGLGFALPINIAKPIIQEIITKGYVTRPGIGVTVSEVTEEASNQMQVPKGVMIQSITKNGPADLAGLKVGDVVTEANGTAITSLDQFISIVKTMKVGDELNVSYWRNGNYASARLVIGDLNQLRDAEIFE